MEVRVSSRRLLRGANGRRRILGWLGTCVGRGASPWSEDLPANP